MFDNSVAYASLTPRLWVYDDQTQAGKGAVGAHGTRGILLGVVVQSCGQTLQGFSCSFFSMIEASPQNPSSGHSLMSSHVLVVFWEQHAGSEG